jgi:hypothetical protein
MSYEFFGDMEVRRYGDMTIVKAKRGKYLLPSPQGEGLGVRP